MYQERFYRKDFSQGWFSYQVTVKETDVLVKSPKELDPETVEDLLKKYRKNIEDYIESYPEFKTTLSGFKLDDQAPDIIKDMVIHTSILDVGPMASVAGAVAQYLGKALLELSPQVIVENGGDIFIKKQGPLRLGLYAGEDNFINKLTLSVENTASFLGVCSSSASLGHSLSLGRADLATVVSNSTIFADALATKLANMVKTDEDIETAIEFSRKFPLTRAALVVKNKKMGLWGDIKLIKK